MPLLVSTHARYLDHLAGRGHPERPDRLTAVLAGVTAAGLDDAVVPVEPRPATRAELERVHPAAYLAALERFCAAGGGALDPDTGAVPASWEAALLAAGAGPDAVERLDRGEGDAAFCAVRPPGHHATATRAMGFCLLNNAAVTAAALAQRGERVLVLDWDAHHGNGTQEIFWRDGRVLYVSLHQAPPFYPGTGRAAERGAGDGEGATVNVALPAGATGDVYQRAFDEVVEPVAAAFGPTWLVVSAGVDAHRADPLTGLGLAAGDFADLAARGAAFVPAGRQVVLLEGGYDLDALTASTGAVLAALVGERWRPEAATSGGPGADAVTEVRAQVGGLQRR